MFISPYISFNGKCREAFTFYEKALGGKIVMMMTYGETPMADEMPAEMKHQIIHVRLAIGNTALMGADTSAERYHKPQGMTVSLMVDTPEEADRIFAEFSDGGNVGMPIAETFWAVRFGMVTDKFGVPWMINCEKQMNF